MADIGGVVVVWRADLYQKETLWQLSDTSFYAKVDKDLTLIKQNILKNTINDTTAKHELPGIAKKTHHHHSQNFVYLLFTKNPQT